MTKISSKELSEDIGQLWELSSQQWPAGEGGQVLFSVSATCRVSNLVLIGSHLILAVALGGEALISEMT